MKHFCDANVSFDYPEGWLDWERDSFRRLGVFVKSQGTELVVMLKPSPKGCICFQVARSPSSSSFEALYEEKKTVAKRVTSEGIEVLGQYYSKYSIAAVDLDRGQRAVVAHAEKPNGETGISYQMVFEGYEYNVNFIYGNSVAASDQNEQRETIMRSFRFLQRKTE
jgi:hypothetical protein